MRHTFAAWWWFIITKPRAKMALILSSLMTLRRLNFCWQTFCFSEHLFYVVWRTGTKPILTPHDGRCQFGLSGIRTCDHPHANPELYYCAMGASLNHGHIAFIFRLSKEWKYSNRWSLLILLFFLFLVYYCHIWRFTTSAVVQMYFGLC